MFLLVYLILVIGADEIVPVEETLSDVDMDMEEFIVRDDVELKTKTEMWDTINKDWIEAQELKKAQLEEAHQVTLTDNLLCFVAAAAASVAKGDLLVIICILLLTLLYV